MFCCYAIQNVLKFKFFIQEYDFQYILPKQSSYFHHGGVEGMSFRTSYPD
jgi:hypothetical protein